MTHPLHAPTSDDKLWAGLAYAGLGCFVLTVAIFVLKRDESAFVRFHTLQAIGFGLPAYLLLVVPFMVPGLGILVGSVQLLLLIFLLAYWIYLMLQAFRGREARIPLLADWIDANFMAP